MSSYRKFRNELMRLEGEKSSAEKSGSGALTYGAATLGVSIVGLGIVLALDAGGTCLSLSIIAATLGAGALLIGALSKRQGKSKAAQLRPQIARVRGNLDPLEAKRGEMLVRLRSGDLSVLRDFADFVNQELAIDLMPGEDTLKFRHQKSERPLVQILGVPLARLKQRTVTRKTGGGYRLGKVYVPVQKERVQTIEMNTLDTGTLAITDRRILFLGAARKLTTKMDKVLELEAYVDALSLTKEGRQSADIYLNVDGELLAAIIGGAHKAE